MKRFIALTLMIMLCVSLTACMGSTTPTEEISTHTLPPTEALVTIEPEWAPVDCDIALVDIDGNAVFAADDFETFAVIGNDDTTSTYIAVRLSKDAASMLSTMENPYLTLTISGEEITDTVISTATGEIELGHNMDYASLCELATTIRGLFN